VALVSSRVGCGSPVAGLTVRLLCYVRRSIRVGEGARLQASGLIFKTEGCWRITGRVGRTTLTFVTRVAKSR
jgi:nicotinate-nucleotide pyrophosphorylase